MNKHYTARFDEINDATGFANGDTYSTPEEVRAAFTAEMIASCFGGIVVTIAGTDDKAAIIGINYSETDREWSSDELDSYTEESGNPYYAQSQLTEWAEDVIRNEWHCEFDA